MPDFLESKIGSERSGVDIFFIELDEQDHPNEIPDQVQVVVLPDSTHFFKFRSVDTEFDSCALMKLESWRLYCPAAEFAAKGAIDDLCTTLLLAAEYDRKYYREFKECVTPFMKKKRTNAATKTRSQKAQKKKLRRQRRALFLIREGQVGSYWEAAKAIAEEESTEEHLVEQRTVWGHIRELKGKPV